MKARRGNHDYPFFWQRGYAGIPKDDVVAPEVHSVELKCKGNPCARLQPVITLAPQAQPETRIGNGDLASPVRPTNSVTTPAPKVSPHAIAGACDQAARIPRTKRTLELEGADHIAPETTTRKHGLTSPMPPRPNLKRKFEIEGSTNRGHKKTLHPASPQPFRPTLQRLIPVECCDETFELYCTYLDETIRDHLKVRLASCKTLKLMEFSRQELKSILTVMRAKTDRFSQWSIERQLSCCAALEELRGSARYQYFATKLLLHIRTVFQSSLLTPACIRLVY